MRKVLIVLTMCLALAACSKSHSSTVTTNSLAKQDLAQAQQVVQTCISQGTFLTKSGRKAVINCVAPSGHGPALENCVTSKITTIHSKSDFEMVLSQCVTANR